MPNRYIEATDAFRVLSEFYNIRTDEEKYRLSFAISLIPTADVVEKALYNRLLEDATIMAEALDEYQTADVPERNVWKWIPVTEKLPEAGIRYQVTFESGEVGYADFRNKIFFSDGSAKENVWEIDRYYDDDGEVIAWMPLTEPYRKETEDELFD